MRFFLCGILLFVFPASLPALAPDRDTDQGDVEVLIDWLLADGRDLSEIPFARVVEAATGREVLEVDPGRTVDSRVIGHLETALDAMLEVLADPSHPIHEIGRVNEVSLQIEDILERKLDTVAGISCAPPVNAAGRVQQAGYPDLRLVDEESGQVFYLDPKVYAAGSKHSTFRTFYYEPRVETNKILDDARHIIIGISHGGHVDGAWQFLDWNLVDLSDFQVRLKAEFQASNRDLYRDEAILSESASEQ